jgi:hypothetical protein
VSLVSAIFASLIPPSGRRSTEHGMPVRQLDEIVRMLRRGVSPLRIFVVTNASLLTPKRLRSLKEAGGNAEDGEGGGGLGREHRLQRLHTAAHQ